LSIKGGWEWRSAIGSLGMLDTLAVAPWAVGGVVAVAIGGAAAVGAVPGWIADRRPTR
jgi:hypothetical protein